MIQRNTQIKLYKGVKLDRSSEDTFYFEDISAQNNYFSSKLFVTIDGCYYQRENVRAVRVPMTMASCFNVNYLSFINLDNENKRYYAYVTQVNYINDNLTELVYEIDYMQTWFFEVKNGLKPTYIDRCHTIRDSFLDWNIKDSLDLGDYVVNASHITDFLFDDLCVVWQTSFDMGEWARSQFATKTTPGITIRTNAIDTSFISYTKVKVGGSWALGTSAFSEILNHILAGAGGVTLDDVMSVWLYPTFLLYSPEGQHTTISTVPSGSAFRELYYSVTVNTDVTFSLSLTDDDRYKLDTYEPKNKIMLQSPYMMLQVSNNSGSAVAYDINKFSGAFRFRIQGTTSPDCKIRIMPENYNRSGLNSNLDEALELTMPTLQLIGDSYSIWLAQNRNVVENGYDELQRNLLFDVGKFAIGGAMSGMSGDVTGTGISAVTQSTQMFHDWDNIIKRDIAQKQDMKLRPATAKGVQSSGINIQNGKLGFSFIVKTIDRVHAKMLDDYYTMFGYPIKGIENINLKARSAYTYIKTINIKINANMPTLDREVIESLFNTGIRFWVNADNIGDYSVKNNTL